MKRIIFYPMFLVFVFGTLFFYYGRSLWYPVYISYSGARTVSDVIEKYGVKAEGRLIEKFDKSGVSYPPKKINLIAIKNSNDLELWAAIGNKSKLIYTYEIKAASGDLGPKLKEGDRQVPEGIYEISYLNPNSSYHLSMKINYPNEFDALHAKIDGRLYPGTNIFIHGKSASIGCLAMGDKAIEELFFLVNKVGRGNVEVVISPTDPKLGTLEPLGNSPEWIAELYENIEARIREI